MNTRVARCHLIASVLAADGIMAGPERELLDRAMDEAGLTDEERHQVTGFEGGELATAALRGLPEADRRAIVDELLSAVLADGQISRHETALIGKLTAALGL
jgi:uncharacterized tellurite resistance protein B-like protein